MPVYMLVLDSSFEPTVHPTQHPKNIRMLSSRGDLAPALLRFVEAAEIVTRHKTSWGGF
jgi:hypothetical protein